MHAVAAASSQPGRLSGSRAGCAAGAVAGVGLRWTVIWSVLRSKLLWVFSIARGAALCEWPAESSRCQHSVLDVLVSHCDSGIVRTLMVWCGVECFAEAA